MTKYADQLGVDESIFAHDVVVDTISTVFGDPSVYLVCCSLQFREIDVPDASIIGVAGVTAVGGLDEVLLVDEEPIEQFHAQSTIT